MRKDPQPPRTSSWWNLLNYTGMLTVRCACLLRTDIAEEGVEWDLVPDAGVREPSEAHDGRVVHVRHRSHNGCKGLLRLRARLRRATAALPLPQLRAPARRRGALCGRVRSEGLGSVARFHGGAGLLRPLCERSRPIPSSDARYRALPRILAFPPSSCPRPSFPCVVLI